MKASGFNLGISSIRGATITEFRQISDKMARVIAAVTSPDMKPLEVTERLTAALKGQASPIRASFRWLEQGSSMIGYVALIPAVRPFNEKAIQSKYRKVTANTFIDKSDESVWEVKPGSGGSYLARTHNDNLAELLEASRVPPRGSFARMSQVVTASIHKDELVAYVDGTSNQVHYGFCVQANNDGSYRVVSYTTNQPEDVKADYVVGAYEVDVPQSITAAVGYNKKDVVDYWKKVYPYAPEYMDKMIQQIEQMAAA